MSRTMELTRGLGLAEFTPYRIIQKSFSVNFFPIVFSTDFHSVLFVLEIVWLIIFVRYQRKSPNYKRKRKLLVKIWLGR